jgi:hypothetical protein
MSFMALAAHGMKCLYDVRTSGRVSPRNTTISTWWRRVTPVKRGCGNFDHQGTRSVSNLPESGTSQEIRDLRLGRSRQGLQQSHAH